LHELHKYGVIVENQRMDIAKMLASKDKAVKSLTGGVEMLLKKNKIVYEKGHGKILSKNEVEVEGLDGKKKILRTKNIIIATGSEPASLPGLQIDEKKVVTSTGALCLEKVPKHLILVGAGVIGLEMGSVWSRLGAKVSVIEFTNAVAAGADGEIAKEFKKTLEKQGLKFIMESKVTGATKSGEGFQVHVEDVKTGNKINMDADIIMVAVGRKPYTLNVGLENVGIKTDKRGFINVDNHWRTSVPNIYAIGDVIPGPMLAHKAEDEGVAVAENIVTPGVGHVNYNAIPSVVYTEPEVAWV
jgi:dihydrolipoamide dehydrogenase